MNKVHRYIASGLALGACMMVTGSAHAFGYIAENMTNWSGCDDPMGGGKLNHTHEQITQFIWAMNNAGNSNNAWYENLSVSAVDTTEDLKQGGQDNRWADRWPLYIYSGHGGNDTHLGAQTFVAPFCRAGGTALGPNMD